MEIYALVGPSGTGKSHRAAVVANQFEAQAIIDDGLLIQGNRIIAGSSAKRQPTRIGAIKAALFMEETRAQEMRDALDKFAPARVLILGTSTGMVERIASRLGLPPPQQIMNIEEFASEKEIRKAKFHRSHFSKHVIPAPTLEVRKSFPGILVDPLHIFLKKKETPGKKDWLEQSIIRPTFTSNGKLTIADSAISAIAGHAARSVAGVTSTGRIVVNAEQEGIITIDISPTIKYGFPLHEVATEVQRKIDQSVETMTGLQVRKVNVLVKRISFPRAKEATS
ncbi:MAG: Asp23/Gls24 family envelope stress response protein [Desulfotomaculaceae bacterium]|nr:Asp23/Gls24 family envelope stress response protein [Desulfotomaculaceae bacterium]